MGVGSLFVAGGLAFGVVSPPERCPDVTAPELRDAAGETVDWFVRNQNADGTWLYLYRPETDTVVDDYNVVRHAGAVMGLYMAAEYEIDGAFELAEQGLEWSRRGLVRRDDWAAVGSSRGEPSTGGTALLLAALTQRREQTGDERDDVLMAELAQFLIGQTEPSGAVRSNYDMTTGVPVDGVYSKYYTGEAYWALVRMARLFPDGPWGETGDRIGAYLATRRDDAEDHWPRLPDHWAAYGLAETAASGDADHDRALTDAEVAYARSQAGLFGAAVRWVSQQAGPWGPLVRGARVPRGGGYGVVGEGLTGLWRVAVAEPRLADVRDAIGARAVCIAGLMMRAQTDGDEALAFAAPDRVQGAWFHAGETRMDDQQHALAALLRTIPIAEEDPPVPAGGVGPSAWLWMLALVAAFNPLRVASGVVRSSERDGERDVEAGGDGDGEREREWRGRAEVVAAGAVAGSVLVLLAAISSDTLLDALDVSAAAFRIAAGAVGTVLGAAAMFTRRAPAEPALPGRRAALVPVAVPLVANAALVLGAMSAAADHGLPVVAAALAVGTLVAVAVTAVLPRGATGRLLAVAARATAAVLLAAGVLLIVDGVLAV
ncbi:MAG: hypothetical protein AB7Q42_23040 [Acidimicrobiia bacterium]